MATHVFLQKLSHVSTLCFTNYSNSASLGY